jgi:hypothetical protein
MASILTPSASATGGDPEVVSCPRCHKPLVDPSGLGWCKSCGYCKSLEEDKTKATLAAPPVKRAPPSLGGLTQTGIAVTQLPLWFWVALVTTVAIPCVCFALQRYYPPTPLRRAVWASIQLGGGLLLVFFAQLAALLRLAHEEVTLSFKDAVVPGKLYAMVCHRLPATQILLYLLCWGFALAISAFACVGGLMYWFTFLPGQINGRPKPPAPMP